MQQTNISKSFESRLGTQFCITAVLLAVLLTSTTKIATAQEKNINTAEKTYLVRIAHHKQKGVELTAEVVDRDKINEKLNIDIGGIRVYASDAEQHQWLKKHIFDFWHPRNGWWFVTDMMSRKVTETGVEPDRVPVQGKKGKQLGTEGMVLLEGGQYERRGEYVVYGWDRKARGQKYQVQVSSFYIDKFKVTNQQFADFLNDGNAGYWSTWNSKIRIGIRNRFSPSHAMLADLHVLQLNYYQAKGYAEWAGKRLATEAEWEYAAGGKYGTLYPWGNELPDKTRANYLGNFKYHTSGDTFPAGASPDGVFDLSGNSAEWVADYYSETYYRTAPKSGLLIDPQGPERPDPRDNNRRMIKGMCKGFKDPGLITCTKRHSRPPLLSANAGISFRCVKDVTEKGSLKNKK